LLCASALGLELTDDVRRGLSELCRVRLEMREENVEVASRRQLAPEPLQLRTQTFRPLCVQQRTRRAQRGSGPARGDTQLMDLLGRAAEARARIVPRDLLDLLLQVGAKAVECRGAGPRRLADLPWLRQLRPPVRHDADDVLSFEQGGLDVVAVAARPRLGDLDQLPSEQRSDEQPQKLIRRTRRTAVGLATRLPDVE